MAGLMDVTRDFSKRFNVTQAEARKCIEFVEDSITKRLSEGETVNLRGFGVFKTKSIGERTIVNPQTKEPTQLKPNIRICFTASDHMKKVIRVGQGLMTAEEAGLTDDEKEMLNEEEEAAEAEDAEEADEEDSEE